MYSTLTNPQVAGVVIPTYSEVWGPTYTWDPATATRISSTPLLPDPWEATMVEVRQSSMEQVSNTNLKKSPSPLDQAGEGLFAIDALPSGTIVSLFNGVRLKTATVAAQNRWFEFLRQIPFVNIAILKTGHHQITESGLTPTLTSTSHTSVLVWRWANYLSPCP